MAKVSDAHETNAMASESDSMRGQEQQSEAVSITSAPAKPTTKRNAFSELMTPKPFKISKSSSSITSTSGGQSTDTRPSSNTTTTATRSKSNFYARHANLPPSDPRGGLLPYIQNPTSFPSNIVLRTSDHTVLIRDLFPKATLHLLLLPRSAAHYNLHPHDALADPTFLNTIRTEAESASHLAANELSRLLSSHSTQSQARNAALDAPNPPTTLPQGRDYLKDIRIGVHAHPSMSHLHIHIISADMHAPALKHRKHYNSFTTEFFIPLADYPLAEDDPRRSVAVQNANLARGFVCWRCGRTFGNQFKKLKAHLEEEFEAWRSE